MVKNFYSKAVSTFCNDDIGRINQKIYLMFHSIEAEDSSHKSIYHLPKNRFKEICDFLDNLRKEAQKTNGSSLEIIFTFDDGYRNYINNALPVLDYYSFKSIIFLIAENINDTSGKYISNNDLKLLSHHSAVKIGIHGYSHSDLSKLSNFELENEFKKLKKVCKFSNLKTNYFSLPFGRANENVISKLFENGYKDIFTSDYGYEVSSKGGLSLYPRIDIWSSDSNNVIKQKLMQQWKLFFIIESYRAKLFRVN